MTRAHQDLSLTQWTRWKNIKRVFVFLISTQLQVFQNSSLQWRRIFRSQPTQQLRRMKELPFHTKRLDPMQWTSHWSSDRICFTQMECGYFTFPTQKWWPLKLKMPLIFNWLRKKKNLMTYSLSRTFKEDAQDACLIILIERMKKTNVEGTPNHCTVFLNFNLKNLKRLSLRKLEKKMD